MKNTGFLLATSAVLAIVAAPAAAQTMQPTNEATNASADAVSGTAKSESQKAAERADARLNSADRAESADTASGDVVVTGSRIVNPNLASAAPIQAVSAQEIKLSGAVNVEDVLNRLPQVVPYAPQADDEGNGTGRINLRNIGGSGGAALILLDGMRLGGPGGADINSIPPALIQRSTCDRRCRGRLWPRRADRCGQLHPEENFKGVQVDANYGFFNHLNRANIVTDTAKSRGFPTPRAGPMTARARRST